MSPKPKPTPNQTILVDECPNGEHASCIVSYYKNAGRILEVCMCSCHSHAKPSPREKEPIIGIAALNDRPDIK
jgi:hypothetical protein